MICNNCGSVIPEESQFCMKCGKKIYIIGMKTKAREEISTVKIDAAKTEETRKKVPTTQRKIFLIAIIVLIMGGLVYYMTIGQKIRRYNEACKLGEEGKYYNAIEILNELGEFRNSIEKAVDYQYLYAVQLMNDKEYVSAIDAFKKIESYDDSKRNLQDVYYDYVKRLMIDAEYIDALDAIEYLDETVYQDKQNLKDECNYNLAQVYYDTGCFSKALDTFKKIESVYDVEHYLEILYILVPMEKNKWVNVWDYSMQRIYELDGWCLKDYVYFNDENGLYLYKELTNSFSENDIIKGELCVTDDGTAKTFVMEGEQLKITYMHSGTVDYCKQGEHPSEYIIPIPQVGMTEDEVLNSRWGEPKEINKTTYAWGRSEQWCYPGYRYVYLENGIVTAVSE